MTIQVLAWQRKRLDAARARHEGKGSRWTEPPLGARRDQDSETEEEEEGMKAARQRRKFQRSSAWLRRARMHYAQLCRPWVERARKPERFRARLWIVAERAQKYGLYSSGTQVRHVMFGILSNWKRHDRAAWWPWMHADKRRASVADWSVKSRWIRMDAEKEKRA